MASRQITLPVGGHHQRIDLDQRRVGLDERAVERAEQRGELADLLVLEPERKRDLARLERRQPDQRIDRLGDDLLGRLGRDLLDLHPALGAGDDRDRLRLAIDHHPEVELARDLARLLDVHAAHDAALGPGLMGHQRLAEQLGGEVARLLGRSHQLDAAGLAAPAGMDLRLDDRLGLPERGERRGGLLGGDAGLPLGTGTPKRPSTCLAWNSWIFMLH